IDTGMGLERVATLLQGADSMYETDLFAPVIAEAQEVSGAGYGRDDRVDRSLRIVTEHGRTAGFLIADGVLPSNEGRGYILRRLLRRSVRHLRLLGVEDPALDRIGLKVVDTLGGAWPELVAQRSLIEQVVASEEESFSRTLRQGSNLLDSAIRRTREQGAATLAGETAFQLHDTYGFPYELTLEAAAEAGLDVDADRFRQLMDDQRRRAKEARRELDADLRRLESYRDLSSRHGRTSFVGYETTTAEGRILGLLREGEELDAAAEGDQVELILDRTPFYAEGGGQVGDTGLVRTADGAVLQVTDTRPGLEGFFVHSARVVSGEPRAGDQVHAEVDADRREAVTRSHTATHTLHWALRDQLGQHARQQGSLVDAGRLRFDFAHFQQVPPEQLAQVEAAVNRQLLADPDVKVWHGSLAEAEAAGAISLFGERYGSVVRVVEVGDFSRELCGGTHVGHGSQVGPVHVVGEASIGANLRRIEALTGLEALHYVDRERQLLAEIAALLKTRPEDAPEQLRRRLEALANAQRELERLRVAGLERQAGELAGRVDKEAG
ncbi:MAG TPA: alanine--tRNA ligase, partial [Actinomycetes bacterium]|nr:alanine--tRNA ligase [Actinomycetes bacterium]